MNEVAVVNDAPSVGGQSSAWLGDADLSATSLSAEDLRLAQQGDAAAFERIYRAHRRKVYSLCLRMAGDAAEAEDLTQEAFMQVFRKIHTFRGDSRFSTWLHRLTVNIVLMRFRKKHVAATSFEQLTEPDEESGRMPREIGVRDLQLGGVIDRMSLEKAIAELPPGYREMFILHDVEGYDHAEIAKIVGCSVGNSKSQVHKARMRLRKLLRQKIRSGPVSRRQPTSAALPATWLGTRPHFARA